MKRLPNTMGRSAASLCLILSASCVPLLAESASDGTAYGADKWGTKYSPLDQINIEQLRNSIA